MNNKFDELARGLAQSVTRRQALKKFGVGLAGMVLAALGVANASAGSKKKAQTQGLCQVVMTGIGVGQYTGVCIDPATCQVGNDPNCTGAALNWGFGCYYPLGDKRCSF
jgi:hypothetical protein